jgi:hypothetical protein
MDLHDYERICGVLEAKELVGVRVHPRPEEGENLPSVEIYLSPKKIMEPTYRSTAVAVNALAIAGLVRLHDRGQGPFEVAAASPGYLLLADRRWQGDVPSALSS